MRYSLQILIFVLLAFGFCQNAESQSYEKTRILFVFDGSYSMYGDLDDRSKIAVAKDILTQMVDSLGEENNVEIAFRAYGHQTKKYKQDCKDTKLEVGFSSDNEEKMIEAVQGIKPKGTTPIAYSLSEAAGDFPSTKTSKNVIILLTDGIEECEGDPCAVSTALQKNNVILKPFIIGLGISQKFESQFDCVGRYYNAANQQEFREVLTLVIDQAVNATTTQVNLLDIHGEPTETDVNMTFYDTNQNLVRYNFYHTMNEYGEPDTLNIDPVTSYHIQVHTTPNVWKKNVSIQPSTHNIIPIKTPQGKIKLSINGENLYNSVDVLVKEKSDCRQVNEQKMNTTHEYLVGQYNLEILTKPKVNIENVKVDQDEETLIEIPAPGRLYVSKSRNMIGSIYKKRGDNLKWVCNIASKLRRERIVLQPGKYRIIARPESANQAHKTTESEFKIVSGGSTKISIN